MRHFQVVLSKDGLQFSDKLFPGVKEFVQHIASGVTIGVESGALPV